MDYETVCIAEMQIQTIPQKETNLKKKLFASKKRYKEIKQN